MLKIIMNNIIIYIVIRVHDVFLNPHWEQTKKEPARYCFVIIARISVKASLFALPEDNVYFVCRCETRRQIMQLALR